MIINETRKQIIELIEPYMEKEKSRGVLYKILKDFDYSVCGGIIRNKLPNRITLYKGNYLQLSHFNFGEGILFDFKSYEYLEDMEMLLNENIIDRIGHYDITAVLKYITCELMYIIEFSTIGYNDIYLYRNGERVDNIPNKPLNLYTEEEDKQLLDLLLKLK